mgnify:CR=1 FL=1
MLVEINNEIDAANELLAMLGGSGKQIIEIENDIVGKTVEIVQTKSMKGGLWYGTFDTIATGQCAVCATEGSFDQPSIGQNVGGFIYLIPGLAYFGLQWHNKAPTDMRMNYAFSGSQVDMVKWLNNFEGGQFTNYVKNHQTVTKHVCGIKFVLRFGNTLKIEMSNEQKKSNELPKINMSGEDLTPIEESHMPSDTMNINFKFEG